MDRQRGLSARLKLTLSYAGFLLLAGSVLLTAVWVFLLRYVPDGAINTTSGFVPDRSDLLRAFLPAVSAALLFLLGLGLVGGWFLAGRMLTPLTRIGAAAQLAADGSLSHRIALGGPRDEFRSVADVFDTMLGRLEAHSDEQQRFAANASHELRTPLAISRSMLEVARDNPARDADALIDRLLDVNTRSIELAEAMLLLSRADRAPFPREVVDLSLVAEEATENLFALANRRGVTLTVVTTDVVQTMGSKALLLRMITNLVQNAIVHNRSEDGTVSVCTSAEEEMTVLRVQNTGSALSPDVLRRLVEPFQRGAERIHGADHAGAGLGLAIVQSITRTHGGTLRIAPGPNGGLDVQVQLPGVSSTQRRLVDPGFAHRGQSN